jgi:hypothetical protein
MKRSLLGIALCASLIACGCSKTEQMAGTTSPTTTSANAPASTANATALTPEQLGQLGALINKQPANADKLLTDQGLTQATFEAAIRKVSSDPAESKRYAAAYKSAS